MTGRVLSAMGSMIELWPWLLAMVALMACSGFFSASEAALFYLRPRDRTAMKSGTRGEQIADRLMETPDRVLSAILFWNLVVNIAFFAISSICVLQLERDPEAGSSSAVMFGVMTLLAIIFFSEMMPKNVSVLRPRLVAGTFAPLLSIAVRIVDPLMPFLRNVNLVSRRLLWPGFKPETYMDVGDIERVIEHSAGNTAMIKQEETVLRNIVQLSNIRIDEWMRPRAQFVTFAPPIARTDLSLDTLPPSGYLLVTEPDSREIERALRLDNQYSLPDENLERLAGPVLCLPWCSTVAEAFEKMSHRDHEVTVVVNEFGDTIGILTIEDILETVFSDAPSRTQRLMDVEPIEEVAPGRWHVAAMMGLRRMADFLEIEVPETNCITIGGVVQETLQGMGEPGDSCEWGPLQLTVLENSDDAGMMIELVRIDDGKGVDA